MHDRRLVALVAWTVVLLVPALIAWPARRRVPARLARRWHQGCCAIAGVDVRITGTPDRRGKLLFVANHASYFDIIVLGSRLGAAFIAKAEVARWPGIGLLAKLGRTVFVRRHAPQCARQCATLAGRLGAGERLILFAEGTSSDGSRVLPFKSALFGALASPAAGAQVTVQPVTIAYRQFRGGLAIGRSLRTCYAWYGDMRLLPHLWAALGLPGVVVELRFHQPVPAAAFTSRKLLAAHAEQQVASGLDGMRAAA